MHRLRKACALLAGALLAGASLTISAPLAAADSHQDHAGTQADTAAEADASQFQQVALAKGVAETGEPMSLAVLPDRSVVHTARDGTVRLTDAGGDTRVAGRIDVYTHDEEGLQGVAADPHFKNNRFIYLYYAPPLNTPLTDAPENGTPADFEPFKGVNRLSRYVLKENGTLDMGSAKTILEVPADRGICCHVAGDMDFDAQGNLYLSTGGDTNPFESDGYAPIDERTDRNPAFDDQRTAANTNDLRGKILRIHPKADGSYDIPKGNLFAPGTSKTRPEIYAMGFRNPFRLTVDKQTGTVWVGDYGPDAGAADPKRGPGGIVEFNRITKAGNFGWPYCMGDNEPFIDFDFATGESGKTFDCDAPKNESPHNTGLVDLPPAQPAWLPYDGNSVPEFENGSESPMAGPVYRFEPSLRSAVKFPREYDGDFFAGEFGRKWIRRIEQTAAGDVGSINVFPWTGTQVMDMAFGPDGALYVLDYGNGFFNGDEHSALYRIENATEGHTPIVDAKASATSGTGPLAASFTSTASDADGDDLTFRWDFGDGTKADGANAQHTYTKDGSYTATVTVDDGTGRTSTGTAHVVVGNTPPKVTIDAPADGTPYTFGDKIPYKVTAADNEDGTIDCSKVRVSYRLGHDSHEHLVSTANGCEGTIEAAFYTNHSQTDNVTGVLDAEYTDGGGTSGTPLTSHARITLQPRHRQAEHFTDQHGVTVAGRMGAENGRTVSTIDDGDWISFTPYHLAGTRRLTARVSSAGAGGTLEVRTGSPDGTLIGSAHVPATGGSERFQDLGIPLFNVPAETTDLYLVFKGSGGNLFDVDDFQITDDGGAPPPDGPRVLVFSKTAAFRHDSIPEGIATVKELGAAHGMTVDATEDAGAFTPDNLAKYAAVVFMSTTGDVLDDTQQAAFEQYIGQGGGYLGVHSASDTEYDWPFYGDLVGAYFDDHPNIQQTTVRIEDHDNPATADLPDPWVRTDELYNFRTNPRSHVHVLASLDESTYTGGTMNGDHPIAWCQEFRGGRAFYTGLGHTKESYSEDAYRGHLLGGLEYVTGQADADCSPDTGMQALFNGQSLDGWQHAGPGGFSISDGTLNSEGGLGLLWYSAKEFTHGFTLKADWKLAGDDNSGVYVGFPASDDPNSAIDKGYEVQIDATDAPDRTTGAIYSFQSADLAARDEALHPPGEWNTYEIRVKGEHLEVFLNGVKINDFTNHDPARSLTDGYVGVQNHGTDDQVSFRNILLRELPSSDTALNRPHEEVP